MISLDIVSGGFAMVSNGQCVVIFIEGLEVFGFPIMKTSFCFTDVKIIAIPATGFVNNLRLLRTIQAILIWKERFDAASVLKNYLEVDKSCFYGVLQTGIGKLAPRGALHTSAVGMK